MTRESWESFDNLSPERPMTPPPNAPEAGSNGEREALIIRLRTHLWVQHDSPNDDPAIRGIPEAADACLAAGFTRRAQQQHDGGAGVDEAKAKQPPPATAGETMRDLRECAAAWEPGVRLLGNVRAGDIVAMIDAARAERDALAAKLAAINDVFTQRGHDTGGYLPGAVQAISDLAHSQRDRANAAIARAEAAEAEVERIKAKVATRITDRLGEKLTAAESRAAALAEALRKEIERCSLCHGKGEWETDCPYCGDSTWDHACITETKKCDRCVAARAALAGNNGNGTGEG